MKKFLVTYHAPQDFMKQASSITAEESQKEMQAWMDWAAKCGEKLLDFGTPLANGRQLLRDGGAVESERGVIGYSLIQADNMDNALALLKDHPHLVSDASCEIEVHESMEVPGS